jgi:hypothetical protein
VPSPLGLLDNPAEKSQHEHATWSTLALLQYRTIAGLIRWSCRYLCSYWDQVIKLNASLEIFSENLC